MSYRSPDIYFERLHRDERIEGLTEIRIDRPAFLGFAERGPIQKPVRITSWENFEEVFGGLTEDAFLPFAVHGFFRNGGSECYVTRVARVDDTDETKNAAPAAVALQDLYGRPTIRVEALNEGTWGNRVRVRLAPADKPRLARVRGVPEPGRTACRVDLAKGFQAGSLVKLTDGKKDVFVELARVGDREIEWRGDQALREPFDGTIVSVEAVEWKLVVSCRDRFEIYDGLSMGSRAPNYFVPHVNERSELVRVRDLESSTEAPFNLPQLRTEFALTGGRDGTSHVSPEDFIGYSRGPSDRRGLWAYEEIEEIGLVAAPDIMMARRKSAGFRGDDDIEIVQRALLDFCERTKTGFAVLDAPANLDAIEVRAWRDRFDSRYGALYYPWVGIPDLLAPLLGKIRYVPPSGHVLGIYAKMDAEIGVHKAPANEVLNEAIALERDISKDEQDELNPLGINCLRLFHGRGIRVWGARSLASDPLWRYVNVRRIFIMLERSIDAGMQWAVFEPNGPPLWKTLDRLVSAFLYKLWRRGFMVGDTPEEAFYVKCDEETNPQEVREAGQVVCEVGIAAVRPAEFIVVRIGQRTRDIITEEPVS